MAWVDTEKRKSTKQQSNYKTLKIIRLQRGDNNTFGKYFSQLQRFHKNCLDQCDSYSFSINTIKRDNLIIFIYFPGLRNGRLIFEFSDLQESR